MDKLEKKARILNLISLIFCFIAILINFLPVITFLVVILAILQFIHIIFGDVTKSYRLLRKKQFLRLYILVLIIFSALDSLILFILNFSLSTRVYFASILISFLADFAANKIRVQKLNKIKRKNKKSSSLFL